MSAQVLQPDGIMFFATVHKDGRWLRPVSLNGQMFLLGSEAAALLGAALDEPVPPPLEAGDAIFDINDNKMVPYVPSGS